MQYAPMQPAAQRTGLPLAGGILLIIVGVLGLIIAVLTMGSGAYIEALVGGMIPDLGAIVVIMGLIGVIFSIVVILGGYFATQRTHFGFAIVAGVFSLIVGLFVWGFGAILGLIGLILIAVAHKEFQ